MNRDEILARSFYRSENGCQMSLKFSYGTAEKRANCQSLLKQIYALRYQVYVNEWKFETPNEHPFGREMDEFDKHAVHFFASDRLDEKVVATSRIILNSDLGFPIEKYFDIEPLGGDIDKDRVGEISRLAVSKEYRQRAIDKGIFGTGDYDPSHIPRYMDSGRDYRRHCEHELVRGIYLSIYRDSIERKLTHWYAVMSRGLYIILKRWGIYFRQIGPEREYHGLRAPYFVSIANVEASLEKHNPLLLADARNAALILF